MGVQFYKVFASIFLFTLLINVQGECNEGSYETDRGNREPAVVGEAIVQPAIENNPSNDGGIKLNEKREEAVDVRQEMINVQQEIQNTQKEVVNAQQEIVNAQQEAGNTQQEQAQPGL